MTGPPAAHSSKQHEREFNMLLGLLNQEFFFPRIIYMALVKLIYNGGSFQIILVFTHLLNYKIIR